MSSMTPMMLEISRDEASMPLIAVTALPTISPDFSAAPRVRVTKVPASSARRLASATVVAIWSSAAAVSSTEAACCSVRLERSPAAERISLAPALMLRAFLPTERSASLRLVTELLKFVRSVSSRSASGVSMR
ncbi:hypothetical protein D9M70_459330 [compost metagenome]